MQFAPASPLEHRVWRAASQPGVWRYRWAKYREGDVLYERQQPEGLIMAEALARCPPVDVEAGDDALADEYEAIVELFNAVERGARDGVLRGANLTAEEEGSNG